MEYKVLNHASIKIISNDKVIYFDPYNIDDEKADYIFVTHDHYDHYDKNTITKLLKENTKIILPKVLKDEEYNNKLIVEPNKSYILDDIKIDVIPSYNINKQFHPKEKEYVGYNIEIENNKIYVMGDTDRTLETDNVKTDYCFVPIGGTFTMNVEEAIEYINNIKPKVAVPIHYGSIVGDINLGKEFKEKINEEIKVNIFIGGE